jgi:hypothetical protein
VGVLHITILILHDSHVWGNIRMYKIPGNKELVQKRFYKIKHIISFYKQKILSAPIKLGDGQDFLISKNSFSALAFYGRPYVKKYNNLVCLSI